MPSVIHELSHRDDEDSAHNDGNENPRPLAPEDDEQKHSRWQKDCHAQGHSHPHARGDTIDAHAVKRLALSVT